MIWLGIFYPVGVAWLLDEVEAAPDLPAAACG